MTSFTTRVAEIMDSFFDDEIDYVQPHVGYVHEIDYLAFEREHWFYQYGVKYNVAYKQMAREAFSIVWYFHENRQEGISKLSKRPLITKLIAGDIKLMLVGKHNDYGTANMLRYKSKRKNELALLIRLRDKTARALNLMSTLNEPNYESLLDTLKDIIGYCVLAIMIQNGDLKEDYE